MISLFLVASNSFSVRGEPPAISIHLPALILALLINFSTSFGFSFAIFIYITVNLSMVLGLLPIVGSPLPIMSYGGSSMLATMVGFGIVLSAKIHSKQVIA